MKIEVRDLGKSYDDAVILERVGFSVEDGDSVCFTSPSGSGKSTLLSMVGLLLEPTSGTILVDGRDCATLSDDERSLLRLKTFGFVFQHTQLIGSLRAWENVAVPARFSGDMSAADAQTRAEELLESVGLGDRLTHFPHQLSIGQKRRVALARALMMEPPVIIADEPTNDLDADNATSVVRTLFSHVENGGILLYATHDPELMQRASRVMHLEGKTFS